MVQFRAIDRRRSAAEIYDTIARRNEDFKKAVLSSLVDVVVDAGGNLRDKAVDTGTYMDAHEISYGGRSSSFRGTESSHGKPRDQNPTPYVEAARARLKGAVETMPRDSTNVMMRNAAVHAPLVEYRYGYAPYTKARREFNEIVARVAGMMGITLK